MSQAGACQYCGHKNRAEARFCGMCGHALPGAQGWPPGMLLGDDQRYRVERQLGAGGFGEAYLVEDGQLQRLCVAKRLKLDPRWRAEQAALVAQTFEREARLLVALNNPGHPHIPEIFAYLPQDYCLVMKYVTGTDLFKVLKERGQPLPEAEALRYMRDVASALAYMHSRPQPVVHGDLKPQNVMLDEIGRIWLIDFGLAQRAATTPHRAEATLAGGTPGYTPPEQWAGRAEPRSDVYALAATLYELVTRQRPPPAAGPPQPAADQVNGEVRPQVAQLIAHGMAAAAADRPHAQAFLAALDELLTTLHVVPPPPPERPPEVGQFVGRVAELAALRQQLTTTGVVGISGMAGIGKTTLAVHLAQQEAPPERIFWHSFRVGERAEVLVTRLAGWLAHLGRGAGWQQLQRAQQGGGLPSAELFVEQLIQLAHGQQVLLCCDNRHWIEDDAELARVLGRLERAARAGDLRLLLTSRSAAVLEGAAQMPPLTGLDGDAAAMLLNHGRLQQNPALRAALIAATEGNPQFLVLANAVAERIDDPQTLLERLLSSAAVEEYLLKELDGQLAAEERQVMEAVALLRDDGGNRAVLELLAPGRGLRRTLQSLVARNLLTTGERYGERIYVQHAIVQHFYYAGLAAHARQTMHRQVATHYAQDEQTLMVAVRHYAWGDDAAGAVALLSNQPWRLMSQGHAGAIVAILASLKLDNLAAGSEAAVRSVYGEASALLGDHTHALSQLERAIAAGRAAGEAGPRQARRYRLLAHAYERSGDYAAAEAACRSGLELSEASSAVRTESARLYTQLAAVLLRRGALAEAAEACHAGLVALPPAPAAPGERSALFDRLATIEGARVSYSRAMEILAQSLALARQAGDPLLMGSILHNMGHFSNELGQHDAALRYYYESLRIKDEMGDLVGIVLTSNNLGLTHLASGATAAAQAAFTQVRELSDLYQLPAYLAMALCNLGQIAYEQGNSSEAQSQFAAAAQLYVQLDDRYGHAYCQCMLGELALSLGDAPTALAYGKKALELANFLHAQALSASALRVLGEAHTALGNLAQAGELLAQAQRLALQMGDPYDEALVLAALAHHAHAGGDTVQARRYAEQSLVLAKAHAIAHVQVAMRELLEVGARR